MVVAMMERLLLILVRVLDLAAVDYANLVSTILWITLLEDFDEQLSRFFHRRDIRLRAKWLP